MRAAAAGRTIAAAAAAFAPRFFPDASGDYARDDRYRPYEHNDFQCSHFLYLLRFQSFVSVIQYDPRAAAAKAAAKMNEVHHQLPMM